MGKKRHTSKAPPVDEGFASPFSGLGTLSLPTGEAPAPAPATPARPAGPDYRAMKVVLRRQRAGRGGKTVTRVEGLALEADARKALAKRLKKQLGCGATWEGDHLVLLGDVGERVRPIFEALGVRKVVVS